VKEKKRENENDKARMCVREAEREMEDAREGEGIERDPREILYINADAFSARRVTKEILECDGT